MKFAHLADTHLGYRQFGLYEREKDFYEVFERIIDRIIEEKVDFVIHSGDLFDNARPSPLALFTVQKALIKLKNANIPIFAIAGNHDTVMRKGAIPPQVLFKKFGLKVISPINTNYMFEDVFIAGLPFYPSSQDKNLKNKLSELSKKAANHEKSILVLHQGIDKYFNLQYELEIGDVPDNFNYYAMGHLHNYINDDFGKGKLVYPGSSEVWKTTELGDYRKNGKGFVIVDFDSAKPSVTRIKIDLPREFIEKTLDYDTLAHGVEEIKETIKDFDKKPILNLTVENVTSTTAAYDLITEELDDLSLMVRPKFITPGEENIDLIIDKENALGPIEVLSSRLESYDDEDITKLAIELYNLLSKDEIEESRQLIDEFYKERYPVEEEEED
ncbi:metallophosphoesterase family protein [Methanobrevibacter millerae]|uniref:DNA double-strand break repair protein Mre11 n=1 Tax=Methanobrevibacter millerae TaxID=230361 RepID=A0A1G5V1H2_9EURY|nr:DNA repair exonuclease [Methanobrevibacter millerae]SDA39729.1 exonuclease SbcD [Methanobrevibacter millerae]